MGSVWEALVKITKNVFRTMAHERQVYRDSLIRFPAEVESTETLHCCNQWCKRLLQDNNKSISKWKWIIPTQILPAINLQKMEKTRIIEKNRGLGTIFYYCFEFRKE